MKRLALMMSVVVVAAGLAWFGVGGVAAHGQTKTILIRRTHTGYFRPEPSRPIFILALGSDQGSPRYGRRGTAEHGHADSIHILAINPAKKAGTIVGIPRDTYVPIPGHGSNKIGTAMYFGGPELMVKTVEQMSGIHFDYYMVSSFEAFEDMVNAIGGIPVDVPYNIKDHFSHSDFKKGLQVLGGFQALAFARNRHATPNGDFSRQENQGLVILGALRRARADTFDDPGKYLHYLKILYSHIKTDIPIDEALRLGMLATRITTDNVRNVTMNGTIGTAPGAGSIVLATPGAIAELHDIADDGLIGS